MIISMPMLRKLLALLMLVTGLAAAAGTPAQARVFDVESVRTIDASYACSTQAGVRGVMLVARKNRADAQPRSCPRPSKAAVVVPTVMLQVDRAHE